MVTDNVMDSSSSLQSENPERLRNLATNVKFSGGNNLLHWLVLEDSHPNNSGSGHQIDIILPSLSNVPANVVNTLNDDGFSALHLAVVKNNLTMVKKLLSHLVNIDVDARIRCRCCIGDCKQGDTALHLAVQLGHLSIIAELLDKGAGIDIKNEDRKTALCYAVSEGHLDTMRLLVSKGADVNLGDMCDNPLFYAVQSKNLEAVEFLVGSGADVNFSGSLLNPLFYFIHSGNSDIIKFLVDNGADVNVKYDDATTLHYAVLFASLEFVEYLVKDGADVNARDDKGATPLYYAISSGKLEHAVFLLDHGADIHARDQRLETPMHCAVNSRNDSIYEFLICSTVWKRHDVVREGNLEIVKLLINQGAYLSAIDKEGRTPLHYTVYGQDLKMVEFLSDRGEDPLAEDRWNPDYDADYLRFAKIIRLLLDRGAYMDEKNEDGKTALDLARNQLCLDALQNV